MEDVTELVRERWANGPLAKTVGLFYLWHLIPHEADASTFLGPLT